MITYIKHYYSNYQKLKEKIKLKNQLFYYGVDLVETLIIAFVLALLIKTYIIQVSVVPTGSMIPTLIGGVDGKYNDRLFVNKFIYFFTQPERGDITVFRSPHQDGKDYVKRCVGLPNDIIEIKQGVVYINGKEMILVGVNVQRDYAFHGPVTVPEGSYFMLGDNRSMSLDSRAWGFVREKDIIGKALFTFWPLSNMRALK